MSKSPESRSPSFLFFIWHQGCPPMGPLDREPLAGDVWVEGASSCSSPQALRAELNGPFCTLCTEPGPRRQTTPVRIINPVPMAASSGSDHFPPIPTLSVTNESPSTLGTQSTLLICLHEGIIVTRQMSTSPSSQEPRSPLLQRRCEFDHVRETPGLGSVHACTFMPAG